MEPVVMTRLKGGLGNQMFQYAAGLALAARHGVPLVLDRSFLDARGSGLRHTLRDYELDVFGIEARFATPLERRALAWAGRGGPRGLLSRLLAPGARSHREARLKFDPAVAAARPPVYLDGYWQDERYFAGIADDLRARFVPAGPVEGRNARLLEEVRGCNSVSVHVRRADYVTNPDAARTHGLCSLDYYDRAAAHVAARVADPRFFVFSDDPEWVAANLRLPGPTTLVTHNRGRAGCWDLFLMRNCRHHVVANSSFSWWGAWLDPSPSRIVVAPRVWVQALGEDGTEIVPPTWTRL